MSGYDHDRLGRQLKSARLMLDEERHRTANELAAALAALRLTKAGLKTVAPLLDQAIERIEGQARLNRLLIQPPEGKHNATVAVRELCEAFVMGRTTLGRRTVRLVIEQIEVGSKTLDALIQVAHELLTNATKHGMDADGKIIITLRRMATTIILEVKSPFAKTDKSQSGVGAIIINSILRRVGGELKTAYNDDSFTAYAILPDGMVRKEGPRRCDRP